MLLPQRVIANLAQCWQSPWKTVERETLEGPDGELIAGRSKVLTKLTAEEMWQAGLTGRVALRRHGGWELGYPW